MFYSPSSQFQGSLLGSIVVQSLVDASLINSSWYRQLDSWLDNLLAIGDIDKASSSLKASELALASIPLILFFHENIPQLLAKLRQIDPSEKNNSEKIEDVLIWGYALALTLREPVDRQKLVARIIDGVGQISTPLWGKIEQIKQFLTTNTTLDLVTYHLSQQEHPSQNAIALAIYCFASTPQDFRLSVSRARQTPYPLTAPLTAALSGASNGWKGIPLAWRCQAKEKLDKLDCSTKISRLFDTWSGIYAPQQASLDSSVAIALPLRMQYRSDLKIISQGEY
jgi:hypothetical protein